MRDDMPTDDEVQLLALKVSRFANHVVGVGLALLLCYSWARDSNLGVFISAALLVMLAGKQAQVQAQYAQLYSKLSSDKH